MGNGNYNHQSINDQKSIFLPMFCRLSLKDVKLNTVATAAAVEPSSPKVSCIGQVKRNNRVIGYPTTTTSITAAAYHHKHTKPKKLLFPTKTLLPAANAAGVGSGRTGSRSCRSTKMCVSDSRRSRVKDNCDQKVAVDISEMDPPLPVVKKVAPPGVGRDEVNIWKRRFKKMEIEPINLPSNKFQLPPTTL